MMMWESYSHIHTCSWCQKLNFVTIEKLHTRREQSTLITNLVDLDDLG